mgnify:CR=1 FL=1
MKSTKNAFAIMVAKLLYIVEIPCPECGGDMYAWRNKGPDGKPRCAPACMDCGYKAMKKAEAISTEKMYNDSLKAKAINYLKFSSLYTDKGLIENRFSNYETMDTETKQAKEMMKHFVNEALLDKPVHAILTGKSGSGKTHLSMAAAWDILERSNYDKRCLFVSYAELLEQLKFAMNDDQVRKSITGNLMAEIKTVDVLVLDDIGAELGVSDPNSTAFNNDTLNRIVEARQDRATIFTTNLPGKTLTKAYGDRIASRMMKNSNGLVFTFTETKDKRKFEV